MQITASFQFLSFLFDLHKVRNVKVGYSTLACRLLSWQILPFTSTPPCNTHRLHPTSQIPTLTTVQSAPSVYRLFFVCLHNLQRSHCVHMSQVACGLALASKTTIKYCRACANTNVHKDYKVLCQVQPHVSLRQHVASLLPYKASMPNECLTSSCVPHST